MPIDTADFQASLGPFGPFAPFTSFAPFAPFARGARMKRETGTWLGSFVPRWTNGKDPFVRNSASISWN